MFSSRPRLSVPGLASSTRLWESGRSLLLACICPHTRLTCNLHVPAPSAPKARPSCLLPRSAGTHLSAARPQDPPTLTLGVGQRRIHTSPGHHDRNAGKELKTNMWGYRFDILGFDSSLEWKRTQDGAREPKIRPPPGRGRAQPRVSDQVLPPCASRRWGGAVLRPVLSFILRLLSGSQVTGGREGSGR